MWKLMKSSHLGLMGVLDHPAWFRQHSVPSQQDLFGRWKTDDVEEVENLVSNVNSS